MRTFETKVCQLLGNDQPVMEIRVNFHMTVHARMWIVLFVYEGALHVELACQFEPRRSGSCSGSGSMPFAKHDLNTPNFNALMYKTHPKFSFLIYFQNLSS